ncbi:MAG: hypothetical protein WC647_08395 [Desulfomonilaceae bacterium]
MNFIQKNVIIRRGWFILPLILWAIGTLSAHSLFSTPRHTASARIQILDLRDRFDPRAWFPDRYVSIQDSSIKEHVEAFRSLDLAQSVIASLKPQDLNELRMAIASSNGFAIASTDPSRSDTLFDGQSEALDYVRRNLSVEPVIGCNMLDVSISVAARQLATELLGRYLRVFTFRNLEKRRMETVESANSLQEAADQIRSELKETEAGILDFVVENGFHATRESRLGQVFGLLNSRVGNAPNVQRTSGDCENRIGPGRGSNFQKELAERLEKDLEKLEFEQSGLGCSLGMNHPRMISLMGRINFTRSRVEYFRRAAAVEDNDANGSQVPSSKARSLEEQYSDLRRELDYKNEFYNLVRKEAQQWRLKAKTISNNVLVIDAPRVVSTRWYQDKWLLWGIIPIALSLGGLFGRSEMI